MTNPKTRTHTPNNIARSSRGGAFSGHLPLILVGAGVFGGTACSGADSTWAEPSASRISTQALALKASPSLIEADTASAYAPRGQSFAGEELTQTRAESLAASAGFELIRFYPCPTASDACAVFEVLGKDGAKIFQYQVSSESCFAPKGDPISAEIDATASTAYETPSFARQSKSTTGSTGAGLQTTSDLEELPQLGDSAPVFACFGGHRVNFRVKVTHALYMEPGSSLFSSEHIYQTYDGSWTAAVTMSQDAASWFEGCTGYASHHVQVSDDDGNIVVEDSVLDNLGCAGSAPLTGDPAEDCKRVGDAADSLIAGVSDLFGSLCDATSLIALTPDNVSFEFGGEDWTVTADKNLNLCAVSEASRDSVVGTAESAMVLTGNETPWLRAYNACLADPGWFFPSVYTPVVDPPVDFETALETLFAEAAGLDSGPNCPSSYVGYEVVDMGGGTVCEGNVRFTCELTTGGSCQCTPTEVVGQLACVTVEG